MKKKVILSSILSIVLCLSLITGATFALFTSESKTNIAVNSGKVNVKAVAEIASVYSPTKIELDGAVNGEENAKNSATLDEGVGTFANGGSVFTSEGAVTLSNITPGDKVVLKVTVTNYSTVKYMERFTLSCLAEDQELFNALIVGISDSADTGYTYYRNFATEWIAKDALADKNTPESYVKYISIELPSYAGNEWQEKTCTLALNVQAVQGNANVTDSKIAEVINVAEDQTALNTLISGVEENGSATILLSGAKWETANVAFSGNKNITIMGTSIGTLTVDAPDATVHVYNTVDTVIGENVALESLHLWGKVGAVSMASGRVVAEAGSVIDTITVNATSEVKVFVANNANVGAINCASGDNITVEYPVNAPVTVTGNATVVEYNQIANTAEDFVAAGRKLTAGEILALTSNVTNTLDTSAGIFALINVDDVTVDYGNNVYTLATEAGKTNWMGVYLNGGTATLNGNNGGIDASKNDGDYAIHVKSSATTPANLTINGGRYIAGTTAVNVQEGTVTINGGFFESKYPEWLLNCYDSSYKNGTANIIVKGGTFVNFNPADNAAEGAGTSYVPLGWKVEEATQSNGDVWYTVVRDETIVLIENADQLSAFAANVEAGNTFSGKTVYLLNNIDLGGVKWNPVSQTGYKLFLGDFDGQGYTVSNFYMDTTDGFYPECAEVATGFFGWLEAGQKISNLTLDSFTITSYRRPGGIVGYMGGTTTVTNCHVTNATIKAEVEPLANGGYDNGDKVGGIAGFMNAGNVVDGCTVNDTTVHGYRDIGGVVGYSSGTIKNCETVNVTLSRETTAEYDYKNYATEKEYDCNSIVGESAKATLENNKVNGEIHKVEVTPGTIEELLAAFNEAATGTGDITINLTQDFDVANAWTAIEPKGYNGTNNVIVNGNGHKITNLNEPLFVGSFGGSGSITINGLTIADSTISHAQYNGMGLGAFVVYSDSSGNITLNDCHLVNSTVECTDGYAGGLVGYVSTASTFTNCSVTGSAISGNKSAGAIVGHGGANVTVNNAAVEGCTISETLEGRDSAGAAAIAGRMSGGTLTLKGTITTKGNTINQGEKAPAAGNIYTALGTPVTDEATLVTE